MHHTAAHPTAHTYSTSNISPLTTHLALNVCEALRRQCPCDEYRDAKGRDCVFDLAFAASDQFSRKQLHRATTCFLRRQRPWTNALGGLCLPCLNRMLGCRWVDGRDEALRWYTSEWRKSRRRLSSPAWWGFHSMGRWRYTGYLYKGEIRAPAIDNLCAPLSVRKKSRRNILRPT